MEPTLDGGYICGGISDCPIISGDKTEINVGGRDCWIVKLDNSGNIQWQNIIGGNVSDDLIGIKQTFDGGYICSAGSNSDISGDKTENNIGNANEVDYWIFKLDSVGNVTWDNTIGGNGEDWVPKILQTNDGGFLTGGRSESNISGDKTENSDGEFDFWVLKLNAIGAIEYQYTIGGSLWDEIGDLAELPSGDFIFTGSSRSNISGDKAENCKGDFDFWILKMQPLITAEIFLLSNEEFIIVYPNPSKDKFSVMINECSNCSLKIELFNSYGQLVWVLFEGKIDSETWNQSYDASKLNSGIYYLKISGSINKYIDLIIN